MEFAAVMSYTLAGETRPWISLGRESKMQWIPKSLEDLSESAPQKWKPWLSKFGWDDYTSPGGVRHKLLCDLDPAVADAMCQCCRAFPDMSWVHSFKALQELPLHVEPAVGSSLPKREPKRERGHTVEPMTLKAVKKEPKTYPSGRDVAKLLLRNMPNSPILKSMLDIGQVLRGCLAVARAFFGDEWTHHVTIVSCGDLTSFHGQVADTLFGVLYSDSHWALLCVHEGQGVVFDGKRNPVCWNQAAAFLHHLKEAGCKVSGSQQKASCPQQPDEWSCGHRVIAAMDLILDSLQVSGVLPKKLDGNMLNEESVQSIIDASVKSFAKQQVDASGAAKRKAEQVPKKSLMPAAAGSEDCGVPSTPPRSKARVSASQACDDTMTPPRPVRPALATSPASNASTPRALVAKTSKPKHEKQNGKAQCQSALTKAGKISKGEALCSEARVAHKDFQKEHRRQDVPEPKGHWRLFLESLGAPSGSMPLSCQACLTMQRKVLHGQQAQPVASAIVPAASQSVLGPEVRSRGRPKKDEARDARWRLGTYISQHRSKVYQQCSKSWSKEAKYYCRPCERHIKFSSHTCKRKVEKHERSGAHLRGLKRLGLPLPEGADKEPESEDSDAESEDAEGQSLAAVCGLQVVPVSEYK